MNIQMTGLYNVECRIDRSFTMRVLPKMGIDKS